MGALCLPWGVVGCRRWATGMLPWVLLLLVQVNIGLSQSGGSIPALLDNMDGPTPILKSVQAGGAFAKGQHEIDRQHFRYGNGAERVTLHVPAGTSVQLTYDLPIARVIEELKLRAEVFCNRPGARLAVTVVLPRSIDPKTSLPFTLMIRGSQLGKGLNWEQLLLSDLPVSLTRLTRVASALHGVAMDERGAYVSDLVFLVPGGPGITEFAVDRVEVHGVLSDQRQKHVNDPAIRQASTDENRDSSDSAGRRIPRIIQWQGEPFELLAQLGFTAVGMDRLPEPDELEQAARLGLSIVCPPPSPIQLTKQGVPENLTSVLAWDLGERITSSDLQETQRWQELVRRHDPVANRPTFVAPLLHLRDASRIADIVLLGRSVLGSDMKVREYAAWLGQRRRLTRPGTPIWARLDTDLSPAHSRQLLAFSPLTSGVRGTSYTQLAALTSAAIGVKSRGFYFYSHSSLATDDEATRERAFALELTNLRLKLVEPWLADGKVLPGARSSDSELSAIVLKRERTRLLLPVWWNAKFRSTQMSRLAESVSFVIPGVAESSECYLLTLAGPERLRHQRVTGGVRVSVDQLPGDGYVLMTNDPQAISQVTRYLRHTVAPRAARIRRELAALRLRSMEKALADGEALSVGSGTLASMEQVQLALQECDRAQAQGNFELAYRRAVRVNQTLDHVENQVRNSLGQENVLMSSAWSTPIDFLPNLIRMQRAVAQAPLKRSILTGGGFENLSALLEAGWKHRQLTLDGVTSSVRLSPESPHSGAYCLELQARDLESDTPAPVIASSPVWITSAPVRVHEGDLVEITGVARVTEPVLGSVDGLQIIDSLGGPTMALRFLETPSWKPFRILRVASDDDDVTVTFSLTGLGKVEVDDLAIRTMRAPSVVASQAALPRREGR